MGLQESIQKVREMAACAPLTGEIAGIGGQGVVIVSDRVKSLSYFLNMPFVMQKNKKSNDTLMHEFVWDPIGIQFATLIRGITLTGSPHQTLARAIGADGSAVCGGIIHYPEMNGARSLGVLNYLATSEFSGHFWENWTPEIRAQYVKYMGLRTGLEIRHHEGM